MLNSTKRIDYVKHAFQTFCDRLRFLKAEKFTFLLKDCLRNSCIWTWGAISSLKCTRV